MDKLIFTEIPIVTLGGNRFIAPIVWQHDDTPLISVVKDVTAGFTTEIPIFHSDGAYIAKVVGSRIVHGPDAKKFNVHLRQADKRTVCEVDGRTVFEIVREEAAALKTAAELYAPNGFFIAIKEASFPNSVITPDGQSLQISGLKMVGCNIQARVGIWTTSKGSVSIGCS